MPSLLELAGNAPERTFAPGEVVIAEGEPIDVLYILKEGEVEIRRDMMSIGKIAKRGAALGEIAALLGTAPAASVVALTPCTFAVVSDATAFVTGNHEATLEVARNLAIRLNWMTGTYVDQIYDDI